MSDRLVRLPEAARRLGVSHRTLQRYIAAGKVPTERTLSGYHRVRDSVLAQLEELGRASDRPREAPGLEGRGPVEPPDRGVAGR